jgi:hypothetical protein
MDKIVGATGHGSLKRSEHIDAQAARQAAVQEVRERLDRRFGFDGKRSEILFKFNLSLSARTCRISNQDIDDIKTLIDATAPTHAQEGPPCSE